MGAESLQVAEQSEMVMGLGLGLGLENIRDAPGQSSDFLKI